MRFPMGEEEVAWFSFPCLASKDGVPRLSYQLAQMWSRRREVRSEARKLSEVKHQKVESNFYYIKCSFRHRGHKEEITDAQFYNIQQI